MALSDSVEDASLSVFILPINICSIRNKQVDQLVVALPRGIEQWNLLEVVFLVAIGPHVDQYLDHFHGGLFVFDDASREHG